MYWLLILIPCATRVTFSRVISPHLLYGWRWDSKAPFKFHFYFNLQSKGKRLLYLVVQAITFNLLRFSQYTSMKGLHYYVVMAWPKVNHQKNMSERPWFFDQASWHIFVIKKYMSDMFIAWFRPFMALVSSLVGSTMNIKTNMSARPWLMNLSIKGVSNTSFLGRF